MMNSITHFLFGSEGVEEPQQEMTSMKSDGSEVQVAAHEEGREFIPAPISASLSLTQSVTYIDFFPRCLNIVTECPEFDSYSSVIEQVNHWLSANPKYLLFKCESVRKKILTGPKIEYDAVLQHASSNGKNLYLNGLRLWLKGKGDNCEEASQQIGCFQCVPWLKNDYSFSETASYKLYPDKFLSLQQKIESVNTSLKRQPLPGRIITVETFWLRSSDPLEFPKWSPERTCWVEEGNQPINCLTILRLFYIIGEPVLETIGIQDFIPKITKEPLSSMSKPQFQTFTDVVGSAKSWLQENKDFRIVNIQSTLSKMEQKNSGKSIVHRSNMIHKEKNSVNMYLKVLSILFVRELKIEKLSRIDVKNISMSQNEKEEMAADSSSGGPKVHKPQMIGYSEVVTSSNSAMTSSESFVSHIPCFTHKLFAAIRRGPKSFESYSRTVDRASYWIKCNKAPLLYLETVDNIFSESMGGNGVKEDQVLFLVNRDMGRYFLTAVWAYFAEPVEELVLERVSQPYVQIGEPNGTSEGQVV